MKFVKTFALVAMLALVAPSPASAHGRWGGGHDHWGHGGPLLGLFGLGAAVVEGTAAVLTAPFYAMGAYSEPAPAYYGAQGPAYYPQAPVYYSAPPVAYAPPPAYYPQYYAPPPPGYYRRY